MSNLLKHAERELALIGYDGSDPYNNNAKTAIMELVKTFSKQGHTGLSASYVSGMFYKLSRYELLSPLTGNDDEWTDESELSGYTLYQNNRCGSVFKQDFRTYDVNAVVWIDTDGDTFTNGKSTLDISSFPFVPKTFYVKVDSERNIVDTEEYEKAKKYYWRK